VEHVRPKYACKHCQEHVTIAGKPAQPIDKGLPGPGLLAQVIVSKYGDHLPLYRLERIFARHGVGLSRSTMCGWMAACAGLLSPLYQLMTEQVLGSRVIHTGDTPVPVQDPGRDSTRQGRV
jgi:transposase